MSNMHSPENVSMVPVNIIYSGKRISGLHLGAILRTDPFWDLKLFTIDFLYTS